MQLEWFRLPTDGDPGTTNLCYLALDLPIIRGRAADPAVGRDGETIDYATLLERSAALAGAVRAVGGGPGERVAVLLDDPTDRLVALLAVLRVGAVHVTLPETDPVATIDVQQPSLVLTSTVLDFDAHTPATVFLRGPEPRDAHRDLDWDMAVKAGRTDPAGVQPVAGDAVAYVVDHPVRVSEVPLDTSEVALHLSGLSTGGCLEFTARTDG